MKILNKKQLKNEIKEKINNLREKLTEKQFVMVEFSGAITEFNTNTVDSVATNTIFSEFDSVAEFTIATDQSDCNSNQIDYKITSLIPYFFLTKNL